MHKQIPSLCHVCTNIRVWPYFAIGINQYYKYMIIMVNNLHIISFTIINYDDLLFFSIHALLDDS